MSPIVHNKIHPEPRRQETPPEDYRPPVVVLDGEGKDLLGVCDGPLPDGSCPFADSKGHLPCDGEWLIAGGFTFKVAEDATVCPVAALGLASLDRE